MGPPFDGVGPLQPVAKMSTDTGFSKTLLNATVRARVAFALSIAEVALGHVRDSEERVAFAHKVLGLCWDWERGLDVEGDDLLSYLERDDGTGLMHCPAGGRTEDEGCWLAVVDAAYYAAWHIYRAEGETVLPEAVNEVRESQLDELVSFAKECPTFRDEVPLALARLCVNGYPARSPEEMGEPVDENRFRHLREDLARSSPLP